MASGFRRLAMWKQQPTYEELPIEEHMYDETKEDGLDRSSMASSSAPSTPGYTHAGFSFGRKQLGPISSTVRLLILSPVLVMRLLAAAWLVATAPTRRRVGTVWPSVYGRFGVFQVLVPSFFQPQDPAAVRKQHPSAWLDGLRGTAAFFVVWHHASLLWFAGRIHNGYGSSESDSLLIQLPIVRLLVSGRPQVAIFFVVSGYALSYKPLKLARQGRHAEAGEAIHSSVFRRHPRLFLMPVVVSFAAALMTHWDWYGTKDMGWTGVAAPERRPPRPGVLSAQLGNWLNNVRHLTNPLSRDMQRGRPFAFDNNVWTLPVEFDCSLVVFLCQAAFCRLRPRVRLLLLAGLAGYAHAYGLWEIFLFLAGMLLCDLHFHLDGPGAPTPVSALSAVRKAAWAAAVFVALFVLSIPDAGDGGADTVGYRTLYRLTPDVYRQNNQLEGFWIPPAAVLLVWAMDRVPALQRPFTTAPAQYFGTISYSMYLVHGPLIWSAGHWLVRHTTALTGTGTNFQYGLGIALCAACLWPLIIYVADLATRTVDVRAVHFGRWLYERWVDKEAEPSLERSAS